MRLSTRALLALAAVGLGLVGWLVWAWGHTESPPWPVLVADVVAVVGLAVGPWLVLSGRQLLQARGDQPMAGGVFSRVVVATAVIAAAGLLAAALIVTADRRPETAAIVALVSIAGATVVALVGGVVFPWLFVLTRTVARERAARARAEERAEMAAHLHDSVLQALNLIQKQADDSRTVRRLARTTERELRTWLYGGTPPSDVDFADAIRATAADIEDRFDVTIELVAVGTCPLDVRTRAMVGAVREALTNAAKHADVREISLFTEVAESEMLAVVHDRGRGFDPTVHIGPGRRGIAASIEGRIRQQGGTAVIRTAVGRGTEIELHLPRSAWHD